MSPAARHGGSPDRCRSGSPDRHGAHHRGFLSGSAHGPIAGRAGPWHAVTARLPDPVVPLHRCHRPGSYGCLRPHSGERIGTMADTSTMDPNVEAALQRIRDLNERILEQGQAMGNRFLDSYEESLRTFAEVQQRLADSTGQDWLSDIAKAQTDLLRTLGDAYVKGARQLLSKS